ncbi:radical SAM protein [Desulfovibrio mangrovi]|uniref:radical SAM/SPASM domain-containing protein n=1 Tax=Desulfovibrio mangrovi TaxID=2976983 RepID=UPI002246C990|nr:radical SAM/SPASM domain-containing protein [Desulfovibrio mangrovi]UZP67510.1 radical SAM protein [Desulfovibrio mangrovi]
MPDRIAILNVEFNSSCNLRCRWCALDHSRPRTVMSPETLDILLSQLAEGALPALKRLDLHNGGETLLHPDLGSMLAVLSQWKTALLRQTPDLRIRLLTNGMLLTERKSRQIIESSAVDCLRFSVDGGSPQQYEAIRVGARWKTLVRNVTRFCELNTKALQPIRTEAICMVPEGHNTPFSDEFTALLANIDTVSLRHPHNWDGSAELGVNDASYRNIAERHTGQCCYLLEHNLVVLPDGSVTVCCNDLNARGVIGTLHETPLRDIAPSPVRQQMKELMLQNRKAEIPLCRNCTGFFRP